MSRVGGGDQGLEWNRRRGKSRTRRRGGRNGGSENNRVDGRNLSLAHDLGLALLGVVEAAALQHHKDPRKVAIDLLRFARSGWPAWPEPLPAMSLVWCRKNGGVAWANLCKAGPFYRCAKCGSWDCEVITTNKSAGLEGVARELAQKVTRR